MVGDLHPLSLATDIHVVYHLKSHFEGQGEIRQIREEKYSIFASASESQPHHKLHGIRKQKKKNVARKCEETYSIFAPAPAH